MSNRLLDTPRLLPPSTFLIVGVCISCYLLQVTTGLVPLHHVTMCPRLVIYWHEYYRIVTSAFFHGDFMHIAMNMMSALALSSLLEQEMGTIRHFVSVLWAVLVTNAIYLLVAYLASVVFHTDDLMYQHAVGFSGVLFHMLVLESSLSLGIGNSRSLFGFASVPSWLYPWVLYVVMVTKSNGALEPNAARQSVSYHILTSFPFETTDS